MLKKPKAITWQMLFYIYLARIYSPIKKNYEIVYSNYFMNEQDEHLRKVTSEFKTDDQLINRKTKNWDWNGFPHIWPVFMRWDAFETYLFIYSFFKYSVSNQLAGVLSLFRLNLPPHCYFIGYFFFHEVVEKQTALLFSIYHLLWRASLRRLVKRHYYTLVLFMVQSQHDIEQFYETLDQVNNNSNSDQIIACKQGKANKQSGLSLNQRAQDHQLDSHELFLADIFCYKVFDRSKVVYKLRPNRTMRSRSKMIDLISRSTFLFGVLILLVGAFVQIIIFMVCAEDRTYHTRSYPECSPTSAKTHQYRESASEHSYNISGGYRVMTLVFDQIVNIIIWGDSGLALTFVLMLAHLMNYDLIIYWCSLHEKIETTFRKVKNNYANRNQRPYEQSLVGSHNWEHKKNSFETSCSRLQTLGVRSHSHRRTSLATRKNICVSIELEDSIYELQSEIYDFFHQVRSANMFISSIVSAAIIIWLTMFATYSYIHINYKIQHQDASVPIVIIIMQAVVFLGVSLLSFSLLSLHRRCIKSYQTICSLMAYDQSKHKGAFSNILDFYTSGSKSYYTFFHQYPFTATAYISLIGWSLSCYFIFDNLIRLR